MVRSELKPFFNAPRIDDGPAPPNGIIPLYTTLIAGLFILLICGGAFFALFLGPYVKLFVGLDKNTKDQTSFRFATRKTWVEREDKADRGKALQRALQSGINSPWEKS